MALSENGSEWLRPRHRIKHMVLFLDASACMEINVGVVMHKVVRRKRVFSFVARHDMYLRTKCKRRVSCKATVQNGGCNLVRFLIHVFSISRHDLHVTSTFSGSV